MFFTNLLYFLFFSEFLKKKNNLFNLFIKILGLGLNICKKIIGLLGPKEELFVSSKFGLGSKFSFVINKYKNVQNFNTNFCKFSQSIHFDSEKIMLENIFKSEKSFKKNVKILKK